MSIGYSRSFEGRVREVTLIKLMGWSAMQVKGNGWSSIINVAKVCKVKQSRGGTTTNDSRLKLSNKMVHCPNEGLKKSVVETEDNVRVQERRNREENAVRQIERRESEMIQRALEKGKTDKWKRKGKIGWLREEGKADARSWKQGSGPQKRGEGKTEDKEGRRSGVVYKEEKISNE